MWHVGFFLLVNLSYWPPSLGILSPDHALVLALLIGLAPSVVAVILEISSNLSGAAPVGASFHPWWGLLVLTPVIFATVVLPLYDVWTPTIPQAWGVVYAGSVCWQFGCLLADATVW